MQTLFKVFATLVVALSLVFTFKAINIHAPTKSHIRYIGPVVLKLSSHAELQTIHPSESNVKFDLDADGLRERTGWIKGDAGFLVVDRNNNGKIDNGSELFGEFTYNEKGEAYENGFAALKDNATDKERGYIDDGDAIYPKLQLWVDINTDGVSDPQEMRSLKNLGIYRVYYKYDIFVDKNSVGFGNKILYAAKYSGPDFCPVGGCLSYDVFFGTITDISLTRGLAEIFR